VGVVSVVVRMMGTLRAASGRLEASVDLPEGGDVSTVLQTLVGKFDSSFRETLLDPVIQSPLANALIILNGVEINNLQGLNTKLKDGDELILLPITHGG
jgi:molybdopterin synthase sulfur carrier subunit